MLYLRRTLELTVVMVTHDLDTLARTCDRVAVLVDGKVIVDTLAGIVKNDHPWIREYFHGARGRGRARCARGEPWNVMRNTRRSALFALARVAAAVAFVWWYSGRGDRREYDALRDLLPGTVSGLSQGSPVRYLGVDVGRVTQPRGRPRNPGRVDGVVEIDSTAPISGATRAKLGLLGLTGLLYIDLQQDFMTDPHAAAAGRRPLPVIASQQGRHRGVSRAAAGHP